MSLTPKNRMTPQTSYCAPSEVRYFVPPIYSYFHPSPQEVIFFGDVQFECIYLAIYIHKWYKHMEYHYILVGGFNQPIWTVFCQIGLAFPKVRGEHKKYIFFPPHLNKYLKPPPSILRFFFVACCFYLQKKWALLSSIACIHGGTNVTGTLQRRWEMCHLRLGHPRESMKIGARFSENLTLEMDWNLETCRVLCEKTHMLIYW